MSQAQPRYVGDRIAIGGDYQFRAVSQGIACQRFWHEAKLREAEAVVTPARGLTLSAFYTYLNTRVQKVTIPSTVGQPYLIDTSLAVGDVLPLSPRHKLTLNASHTLPLDPSVGEISFGGTWSYSGKRRVEYTSRALLQAGATVLGEDLAPARRDPGMLPSLSLVNLSLDWKSVMSSRVDLSAFVTNLLGKKYYVSSSGFLVSTGLGSGSVGEPRMFGGRVRVNF